MKYLLDTHILLWFLSDDAKLPDRIKSILENTSNKPLISIASFWEITIKVSLNKLSLEVSLETLFQETKNLGFENLNIQPNHLLALKELPFHHRDPFDRLIISQAIAEDINLISLDRAFKDYPVSLIQE